MAAHDGLSSRIDTRGLDLRDNAVDRQRVVTGDLHKRAKRWGGVQLDCLGEEVCRRRLDDLTDEPVPYWPAYYPGPGGEA